ncbi:hypothetical protein [Fusobacterium varium]|mgnify:CR=1 FL=1|uniref:hypothetical protein n=1 Tax=Fusobacterium varium TaxID=856 RepID=UPI0024203FDC|nr:hypothetical protein [Fusobacterium varium]
MKIDIRNFIGQEKFEKINIAKGRVTASDSYMVLSVDINHAEFKDIKIDDSNKFHDFIWYIFPKDEFELEFDRNQEIIEENCCGCNGSGYEHKCECGANIMATMMNEILYGPLEAECKKCDDTGVRASTKDEEGSYRCSLCHGTGKRIKKNEEMLKVGESYIKIETLQKLLLYVGRDIQIFADGKKETPLFFKNDIAYGLVASCRYKEARDEHENI